MARAGIRYGSSWTPYADPNATDDDFNCLLSTQFWYNSDKDSISVVRSIDRCRFSRKATDMFRLSRGLPPVEGGEPPSRARVEAARAATLVARTKLFDLVPFVSASGSFEGGYAIGEPAGLQALYTREARRVAVKPSWIYQFECSQPGEYSSWPAEPGSSEMVERETIMCRPHGRGEVGLGEVCFDRVEGRVVDNRSCYPYPHMRFIPVARDEELRGWIEEQKSFIDGMRAMDSALSQLYDVISSTSDSQLLDLKEELSEKAVRLMEEKFGPWKPHMR